MAQTSRSNPAIGGAVPTLSYRNSLQANALKLVAKKLQSSLAVEGELPEDGLAAYGNEDDDLMMALARQIVSGEVEETASVEEVFAQARDAESISEEFLVDQDWRADEPEPEDGEDHRKRFGPAEPTEEPKPVGAGETEEPAGGHQSLFSWAEFLTGEQGETRGRGRKPKPSSQSLFQWALSLEQERDEELVGERR